MKKNLLLTLLVVAAILFSCKKEQKNEVKLENLSVDPVELTLVPGDTVRLSIKWTPTELAEPEVEWTTSDTNVVQLVDLNGAITAVGTGEAYITVTSGDIEGKAKITVVNYEDVFALTSVIYYFPSSKKLMSDSIYVEKGASGAEYKCRLYNVELFVPSTDYEETEDGVADGEGYAVFANANVLIIEESPNDQYLGSPWDLAMFITEDEELLKSEVYAAAKGEFDVEIGGPVIQAFNESIDEYLATGNSELLNYDGAAFETAFSGAVICNSSITKEGVGYSYAKDGLIQSGYITSGYDSETETSYPVYDFTMNWLYGWYGLAIDYESEAYTDLLIQPFEAALSEDYHYVSERTLQSSRVRKPVSLQKPVYNRFIADKPVKLDFKRFSAK